MGTTQQSAATSPPSASFREQAIGRLRTHDASTLQLVEQVLAWLASKTADNAARANAVLSDILDTQSIDEEARDFGQFPMRPTSATGDLNNAVFLVPGLIDILAQHRDALSGGLAERLDQAAQRAVDAALRRWDEEVFDHHRDQKAYTNVFLLYTQSLLLAGRHYDDGRLLRVAAGQWQRWFNHVTYLGIDEFVSDPYSNVDFQALRRIHASAIDDRMKRQVHLVLDHLCTLGRAVTHPLLGIALCGSSRDYRRFLCGGRRELDCVKAQGDAGYRPPRQIVEAYQARQFPYQASGRATPVPFLFQSWQLRGAGLGSMSGGNYFWQQIHCIAAAGESADRRELVFLPGSYSIAGGYVCQREGRALCVFGRVPVSLHRTQRMVPDSKIADTFGDLGVGMTDSWRISHGDAGRLTLSAYDHAVTIDPFVVVGEHAELTVLRQVRRTNLSQNGRFHSTPTDMQEWVFPVEPTWLGCVVQLAEGSTSPRAVTVTCERSKDVLAFRDDAGLCVRLWLNPAGGVTEVYEHDWRTLPLLQCAEQTLWPGELAARSLDE